jgi:hypothetical protein
MVRTKLILAFTMCLVMAAGLTVGRLSVTPTPPLSVTPSTHPSRNERHDPPYVHALNLTVVQHAEIDQIWQTTKASLAALGEESHSIDKDRETLVLKLFTPDQLAEYNKIVQDSKDKKAALDKDRKAALDDGNSKTRALLDEGQQKIFDDWMKQQQSHGRGRGPGGPRMVGTRASSNAATTQP